MKLSYEEWLSALDKNPWKLSIVPEELINYELLDKVLEKDGGVLQVIKNRGLLHLVPDELLELAVQTNGSALAYIPYHKKTERMCFNAVTGAAGCGENLEFVPLKFRLYDICKRALNESINSIFHIPADIMDIKMIIIAIESGIRFREIPENLYCDELFEIGVTKDPETLSFVKASKKTRKLCLKALEHFGEAFNFIPRDMIDQEFIDILNKHKGKLVFIPEEKD
jgi:hypothetical protein